MSRRRWFLLILALAGLQLAACRPVEPTAPSKVSPAAVKAIEGTSLSRVTLTADAARRLGIETTSVRRISVARAGSRTLKLTVPYSAVIYDKTGESWVFTTAQPLEFVRQKVAIDYIENKLAVLSTGPAAGTAIVTVGSAELFGVELGIGA